MMALKVSNVVFVGEVVWSLVYTDVLDTCYFHLQGRGNTNAYRRKHHKKLLGKLHFVFAGCLKCSSVHKPLHTLN
jgi:hypothetical protein